MKTIVIGVSDYSLLFSPVVITKLYANCAAIKYNFIAATHMYICTYKYKQMQSVVILA